MKGSSQLIVPQSTTTLAKTPPPVSSSATSSKQENCNQRLQLYNSLFGQKEIEICDKTGLKLISSLNYSLHTFLHLSDTGWVLAMINIDGLNDIKEKYIHQQPNNKINQVGIVLKKFCDNDSRKLKGFRCNDLNIMIDDDDDGSIAYKCDLFAILMYCYPKLEICEKYILKLMKKIKLLTNKTSYIGIAKMNKWETFEQWKYRAIENMKIAQKNTTIATTTKTTQATSKKTTKTEYGTFYSDISIVWVNPKGSDEKEKEQGDEKNQQQRAQQNKGGMVQKLGNKNDFDSKMKEIANNEDYEWIAAIMDIDEFDTFLFENSNNKQIIKNELNKVEKEIFYLFTIYGNDIIINSNNYNKKYYGYKLSQSGHFGLILYDSKDANKCFVPGHEILETLKEEISFKCKFTVSIGSSKLIEDDLGMSDEWLERTNNNLTYAKNNGKNQVCFGTSESNHCELEEKITEFYGDEQDDVIEVCFFGRT